MNIENLNDIIIHYDGDFKLGVDDCFYGEGGGNFVHNVQLNRDVSCKLVDLLGFLAETIKYKI